MKKILNKITVVFSLVLSVLIAIACGGAGSEEKVSTGNVKLKAQAGDVINVYGLTGTMTEPGTTLYSAVVAQESSIGSSSSSLTSTLKVGLSLNTNQSYRIRVSRNGVEFMETVILQSDFANVHNGVLDISEINGVTSYLTAMAFKAKDLGVTSSVESFLINTIYKNAQSHNAALNSGLIENFDSMAGDFLVSSLHEATDKPLTISLYSLAISRLAYTFKNGGSYSQVKWNRVMELLVAMNSDNSTHKDAIKASMNTYLKENPTTEMSSLSSEQISSAIAEFSLEQYFETIINLEGSSSALPKVTGSVVNTVNPYYFYTGVQGDEVINSLQTGFANVSFSSNPQSSNSTSSALLSEGLVLIGSFVPPVVPDPSSTSTVTAPATALTGSAVFNVRMYNRNGVDENTTATIRGNGDGKIEIIIGGQTFDGYLNGLLVILRGEDDASNVGIFTFSDDSFSKGVMFWMDRTISKGVAYVSEPHTFSFVQSSGSLTHNGQLGGTKLTGSAIFNHTFNDLYDPTSTGTDNLSFEGNGSAIAKIVFSDPNGSESHTFDNAFIYGLFYCKAKVTSLESFEFLFGVFTDNTYSRYIGLATGPSSSGSEDGVWFDFNSGTKKSGSLSATHAPVYSYAGSSLKVNSMIQSYNTTAILKHEGEFSISSRDGDVLKREFDQLTLNVQLIGPLMVTAFAPSSSSQAEEIFQIEVFGDSNFNDFVGFQVGLENTSTWMDYMEGDKISGDLSFAESLSHDYNFTQGSFGAVGNWNSVHITLPSINTNNSSDYGYGVGSIVYNEIGNGTRTDIANHTGSVGANSNFITYFHHDGSVDSTSFFNTAKDIDAGLSLETSSKTLFYVDVKKASSYAQSDLVGQWYSVGIKTPGFDENPSNSFHYFADLSTYNSDGSGNFLKLATSGNGVIGSVTSHTGSIINTTTGKVGDSHAYMNATKDVIVTLDNYLFIELKKGSSYSTSDLTGTWNSFGIKTPQHGVTDSSNFGYDVDRLVFTADGSLTATQLSSSTPSSSPDTGKWSVGSDGKVNTGSEKDYVYMNANKNVMVQIIEHSSGEQAYQFSIFLKK
jgi:hypothetical protein